MNTRSGGWWVLADKDLPWKSNNCQMNIVCDSPTEKFNEQFWDVNPWDDKMSVLCGLGSAQPGEGKGKWNMSTISVKVDCYLLGMWIGSDHLLSCCVVLFVWVRFKATVGLIYIIMLIRSFRPPEHLVVLLNLISRRKLLWSVSVPHLLPVSRRFVELDGNGNRSSSTWSIKQFWRWVCFLFFQKPYKKFRVDLSYNVSLKNGTTVQYV